MRQGSSVCFRVPAGGWVPNVSPGCSLTMTDGQTRVSLEKRLVIFVAFVLYSYLHVVFKYVLVDKQSIFLSIFQVCY